MKCRSEWQRPATRVRIRTSRGPGLGTLTSSITSGLLTSCRTAAFIGVSSFCLSLQHETLFTSPTQLGFTRVGHLKLSKSDKSDFDGRGEIARGDKSLRRQNQFANLGHPDAALTKQMVRDGARCGIFREPERVARRYPMVDHRARQQKHTGIAAHF